MLSKTLSLIEQQFMAAYEVTTTIKHKGEKGRQREHGLATLLREHLPGAYGVATGELVSHTDDENSPQCDIIIYDHLNYPVLGKTGAVQLVPIEAVYSVIEVKTKLDAKELGDAEKKFSAIQKMPRCAPRSKLKKGRTREPQFVIFSYKLGMKTETIVNRMATANPDYLAVSLDLGFGIVLEGERKSDRRSVWYQATDPHQSKYGTLAAFYALLLMQLQRVDLGEPDYWRIVYGKL